MREIPIDLSKSRSEILSDIKKNYGYNPDTQLKFIVNGKMRDVIQIVKMASLGDIISIIPVQAGAAFSAEQYKLLSEIYQKIYPKTKNQDIDLKNIEKLLKQICVDENLARDLINHPMDLDTILHLQYRFEKSNIDPQVRTTISREIENYIFKNGIVFSTTEQVKKLFNIYSKLVFMISDIKGHFFGTKDMSLNYLKESSKNHIFDILTGEKSFTAKDWQKLRWLVLQHAYINKELVSTILDTLNDPIFEEQYVINTKGVLKTVFPFSETFPEGSGGGRLKFIVSDELRTSLLENLKISDENDWNDLIDNVRKENHWGKWRENGPNVAVIKFNLKFKNGLVQTGYIFARSGGQTLADSTLIIDGKYTLNPDSYFNREYPAKTIKIITDDGIRKYDAWYDAERKGIITLESMFPMEKIVEGDLTIVSERPYCPSCRSLITKFAQNYQKLSRIILLDGVRFK